MMKVLVWGVLATLFAGCGSTPTIVSMKKTSEEDIATAYKAGKKADIKYLFDEFSDSYEKEEKIKKIAILYFSVGFDPSKDLGKLQKSTYVKLDATIDASYYPDEYQKVVDASMKSMVDTFKKLGYEVITPEELSQKSSTYRSLATQTKLEKYSTTPGRNFLRVPVKESRYIHMMTNEGKLLSKINSEAPDIDAFIGFDMESWGKHPSTWIMDKTPYYGVLAHHSIGSFFCVAREKAKKNGVKLGWFGDANDCARGHAQFKMNYYLAGQNSKGTTTYENLKELSFGNLEKVYGAAIQGLVEKYYEEGLKD